MKKITMVVFLMGGPSLWSAPSCENPRIIGDQETYELIEDIEICGRGSPFKRARHAKNRTSKKLVITSSQARRVLIKKNSRWDLSECLDEESVLEFSGDAQLVCEEGATLCGIGGTVRFCENARFLIGSR